MTELKITMAGRAAGKSALQALWKEFDKMKPAKIIWHHLPGRKLKATWEVQPRGREYGLNENDMTPIDTWEVQPRGREYGLNESDMEPIEAWLQENIPTARRMSFDTWLFNADKHVTMFLLRWS
jgi:hypothetical protein